VLLHEGRARLAGDIDDLIAATHGQRHSNLLVRQPAAAEIHPQWQAHPVSLEDLVLAYLEQHDPDHRRDPDAMPIRQRRGDGGEGGEG
jgi:ABC-2 type transport system ATP-binding protein